MENIENNKCLYFDTDADFEAFAVIPQIVIVPIKYKNGDKGFTQDFCFTEDYLKALKNGQRFTIRDRDSKIAKRGCVCCGTCSKPVENLDPYWEWIDCEKA